MEQCKHTNLIIRESDNRFQCEDCGEDVAAAVEITGGRWQGFVGTSLGYSPNMQYCVADVVQRRGRPRHIQVKTANTRVLADSVTLEILDTDSRVGKARVDDDLWVRKPRRYSCSEYRIYRVIDVTRRELSAIEVDLETMNLIPDCGIKVNRATGESGAQLLTQVGYTDRFGDSPLTLDEMIQSTLQARAEKAVADEAAAAEWDLAAKILQPGWEARQELDADLTMVKIVTPRYGPVTIIYTVSVAPEGKYNRETREFGPEYTAELTFYEKKELDRYAQRVQAHTTTCRGETEFAAVCWAVCDWML